MAVSPQQPILARLKGFSRLTGGQQVGLMLMLATVIALVSGAWMWSQAPDYRVLYSNLSDRDGGTIINALQQMNVPYKMAEGGGAILVSSTQVYDVRLRLASQGLPKGSVVGFELMENQKLGTSQFLEQVNYQRALEGELTRSIQSISAVQGARVHLAIPRPSVFTREQQKPSASILVSLHPGRLLDKAQVSGIVHLVSSSVPDLPIKNITVLDQNGNLLSAADDGKTNVGLDPGQLEYLHQVEQSFIKHIEDILSPITGAENVRAQVAAELDFSQTEQTAETFRPNATPDEASIRSQQSNEASGGAGQAASGVPGALSNQPPGAASAPLTAPAATAAGAAVQSGGGSGHKESTVNYELDKTIKHIKSPVGSIKRLSVAVVVNYKKVVGKDGKVSVKQLTAAEMAQISNLVKEAMGYRQDRGDSLNVVNASFSVTTEEIPAIPIWKDPATISLAQEIAKNLLIAGILFLLVFKVLRPLFKELSTPPPPPPEPEIEAHHNVPVGAMKAAYEDGLQLAKVMAREEPKVVASVVKDWIGSNE